jgi:3-methyl-2-oxobutanoate hydroxymethyltransferase
MSSQAFRDMKRAGHRIAMLTAYDAPTARIEAGSGVDVILVGDSVGTNMLGYASEKDVTIADMVHHVRAVRRGAPDMTIVGDLPWGTCATPADAIAHSRQLVEAGADMVKFEGARPDIVEALKRERFEVCCHIGLEPQNHEEKRLKGRTAEEAQTLFDDARRLDAAGADMIVLELVPEELGGAITKVVGMPTIGIGAGRLTDGQVLVVLDLLGWNDATFKHNRRYAEAGRTMAEAFAAYVRDVHDGAFPAQANAFRMKPEEAARFLQVV